MPALFVLQRQPLREQEWLLDIFSEQHGRLYVITGRSATAPDLLQRLDAGWGPDDDWPRLRGLNLQQQYVLDGDHLYCGLYLTELLGRLLPRHDPLPDIFRLYCDTLQALVQGEMPDPWLRLFEIRLLTALGYGFSWQQDTGGLALAAATRYRFVPREGFTAAAEGYAGADLLAFAAGDRRRPQRWQAAKQVLRLAIDDLLDKPLVSRELFIRPPRR